MFMIICFLQGGCCKICGGVTHLAKDCPDKGRKESAAAAYVSMNAGKISGRSLIVLFLMSMVNWYLAP